MFGKAKKKILGEKDEAYESSPAGIQSSVYTSPSSGALSGYDPSMWEPQELGQSVDTEVKSEQITKIRSVIQLIQ